MNIPTPAEVHELAVSKGWYDGPDRTVPELLCLIHSEISEALEAYRTNGIDFWFTLEGKPEGVAIELADAVIRIFDMCAFLGLDIETAIRDKHEYNKTRSYRHGGKKC